MMRRALWAVAALFLFSTAVPSLVPEASAYGTGKKKEEEKKPRRPVLEYQKFRRERKIDMQMAEKRKVIRDQLQTLLQYEKDPKERPGLLFRLAENLTDEATAYFNQAQQLDEKLSKDPQNEALRREVDAGKKSLFEQERKWRLQAVDLYRQIAKEYPDYPGRDQVLFYLGYSMWDMDQKKEALSVYKEMISSYPKSQFVPDAYLAFGEFYFDQALLDKALMAYKKVAEYEDSEVYPYAIYKQGWCYYNLHEWGKAKEMFEQVVLLADIESGTTGKKIEIRKEALNDYTLTYSHEGSADAAPRVFKKLAPAEAHKMLINLSSMLFADGQDKKAIILYRYLINEEKCSAEVPFYQGRIVDCGSRVGDKRYTVAQVRRLVELFKEIQQCIKSPTEQQKNRIAEARELAELTMRKLADTWYKEAKETKQKETFEYAQEMFGDYLDLFPESKDAYDMRFAYAELLFHRLARFERAAAEYTKVVAADLDFLKKNKKFPERKPDHKGRALPGTYLCDAAYKAVLAHREVMKDAKRQERRERKKKDKDKDKAAAGDGKQVVEKKPIPKYKKRFIQAAEIYLDHCPKDQDILSVKFDIAKTFYDYNHFDESLKRFDEIVRDFPGDELAEYAANLILDTFNIRQDWDNLNTYSRKFYKSEKLMKNEKLRKYLTELIPQIAFKRIGGLEERLRKPPEGKKPLSEKKIQSRIAYAYIKFWKEFPGHDLADESLFNAGVKYEQSEQLDKALKARMLLVDKYPNSDLVPGTIFNLAENYERTADFDKAASLYERYAETYKKMAGLGKAVSYKKGAKGKVRGKGKRMGKKGTAAASKKPKKAEKRFEGNRRTWNMEDAQDALLNAGIYREALRQFPQAIKDRLLYVELFPRSKDAAQVYYSLGLLYERMAKFTQAAEVFKKYSNDYIRDNLDRALASHMKRAVMLRRTKKSMGREIEKEMQTVLALYRKHSRANKNLVEAAEAAAHAEFILSEPTYKDYIKFRFKSSNPKDVKKQLDEKIKRFKKVERVYTEIAKLKQPEWAIASLYKLGRAYEDFAETFYKAPLPKGLTPEQKDLYMDMLRQQGMPYEDKAVAHFKAAVDKGSELGFYSNYTQLALEKLQQYRPAEYPREQLGFELSVVADPAWRSPLLQASWDEARKNPDTLKEPPLTMKRQGGEQDLTPAPVPESGAGEPEPESGKASGGGDETTGPAAGSAAEEPKPAAEGAAAEPAAKPAPEPVDPVDAVMGDDEPADDFD